MSAKILDGKTAAIALVKKIKNKINYHNKPIKLTVILIGSNAASEIYVKRKKSACNKIGINCDIEKFTDNVSENEIKNKIKSLNNDESVNGILIQLPLPKHLDTRVVLNTIDPNKDVDALTDTVLGKFFSNKPTFKPCTPNGIIHLLKHFNIEVAEKNVCVIGSSNLVGKPLAIELLHLNATPTLCHKLTKNLKQHVENAEIIISATGCHNVVQHDWLIDKIVIDVGIHRMQNGIICGDLHGINLAKITKAYSPVPGGVGPMTIASLLLNLSNTII